MAAEEAAQSVQRMTRLEVVLLDVAPVRQAIDTSRSAGISLWAALVVEAARYARCDRILTEDLSHDQTIRGVTVHNPFLRHRPTPEPLASRERSPPPTGRAQRRRCTTTLARRVATSWGPSTR